MCGRYARRGDKQRIAELFRVTGPVPDFSPEANVTPQSMQPVVRLDREGRREIVLMRWGLVPYWSKDAKTAYSTINARAESISTAAAFREAMRRRRCLVPADAFYEWQKLDAKNKQPWSIALEDGGEYAFAGLWERWRDPSAPREAAPLDTFTILTTDPNALVEPLHTRMPVILRPVDYDRWLLCEKDGPLPLDLLRPYPAEEMLAFRVSKDLTTRVGNGEDGQPGPCLLSPSGNLFASAADEIDGLKW